MPLPFGLKLKRTRRYTVSSKSCLVARIQLLNNEFVEFTLSVESTGQESLEAVAQRLELREVSCKRGCTFSGMSSLLASWWLCILACLTLETRPVCACWMVNLLAPPLVKKRSESKSYSLGVLLREFTMSIFLTCLSPVPSIKAVENQICMYFALSKFPLTIKAWLGQSGQASVFMHACMELFLCTTFIFYFLLPKWRF